MGKHQAARHELSTHHLHKGLQPESIRCHQKQKVGKHFTINNTKSKETHKMRVSSPFQYDQHMSY